MFDKVNLFLQSPRGMTPNVGFFMPVDCVGGGPRVVLQGLSLDRPLPYMKAPVKPPESAPDAPCAS